jgi:hypothetical protein
MVSGALSFGIGTLFQVASIANSLGKTGVILARAGLHAVSMGVLSSVSGGSFWSGAASGAFASLSGDFLSGIKGGFFSSNVGKLATGITSGGVGSVLAGGNFWQGAMNGFFVTAFNHLEHQVEQMSRQKSLQAIKKQYPRLYEVLSKLPQYLKDNPQILETLSKDTGLTNEQILKFMDINSSEGQIIKLAEMKNLGQSGYPKSYLNEDLVKTFEGLQNATFIQGTSFLLAVTVLHEFVHWGRAYKILSSDAPNNKWGKKDYGSYWELKTFGTVTGVNTETINLSYKYGWKF